MVAGGYLLLYPIEVVLDIDRFDLAARRHHVIHGDVFKIEQIHQEPVMFARQPA